MINKHTGSSFEDWLNEEGMLEEVDAAVTKGIIARQIEQAISEKKISKAEMARRMKTSRKALDRLLDPENVSVTLITMEKAAHALNMKLTVGLI